MDAPASEQLQRLPLRAVVAYASRAARRISASLKGYIPANLIEDTLAVADRFVRESEISADDMVTVLDAAGKVMAAAGQLHHPDPEVSRMALSVFAAGMATNYAIQAVFDRPSRYIPRAAKEAALAGRLADALEEPAATAALDAASRDYELFVAAFGEHDGLVVGDPFDPSQVAGPVVISLPNQEH
jgi:hypothetical protein